MLPRPFRAPRAAAAARAAALLALTAAACARPAAMTSRSTTPPPHAQQQPPHAASATSRRSHADPTFLERWAATGRFGLGAPAGFQLDPAHHAVLFLRSGPRSFVRDLYELDLRTGAERVLLTAAQLLGGAEERLSPEERARRERMRLSARGITSYALAPDGASLLVPLSGRLYVVDRASGRARELASRSSEAAIDPRFSPDGARVAAVRGGALYVTDVASGAERVVTPRAPRPTVTYGLAEFIAQEEMDRGEGYWWSPDSDAIAFQETNTSGVEALYIPDPTHPEAEPESNRYPRAGRANADVRLGIVAVAHPTAAHAPRAAHGPRDAAAAPASPPAPPVTWVSWDRARYPYLATVRWQRGAPLTLVVQNRAQTECAVLAVEPRTGATRVLLTETDPAWIDLDQTVPRWLPDGSAFLWSADREGGARVLELRGRDGQRLAAVTPPALGYRALAHLDGRARAVYVLGGAEPTEGHVYRIALPGAAAGAQPGEPVQLTHERGEHDAQFADDRDEGRPATAAAGALGGGGANSDAAAGGAAAAAATGGAPDAVPWIHIVSTLEAPPRWLVERGGGAAPLAVRSVAEAPGFAPRVELVTVGERAFRAAIVRPRDFDPSAAGRYPVILNVYGGPGVRVATASQYRYLLAQWMADHGYVVVSLDGRGTPHRGREWSRALRGQLGDVPLADQVAGLAALGARMPELDLSRVGIFGWSFGGYLSALAVERRPDVFRVAVAGAPVADWRDYDTHYTERYLGLPDEHREDYDRASLLTHAAGMTRPLLVVHGTADDNVYFVHGLRLSDALFRAGRAHEFLPLSGHTHVVADPTVVQRLYDRIMATFERHLGAAG